MTRKQSRRTQRALEKALFEAPRAEAPPAPTPEEEIARAEKLLGGLIGGRLRKELEARIERARARIRVRETLEAEMKIMVPTIHLNGTSGDDLLRQHREASFAIQKAMGGLSSSAPNARDYYVQGDTAFKQAQSEYGARMERLRSIDEELEHIIEKLEEQQDARTRR